MTTDSRNYESITYRFSNDWQDFAFIYSLGTTATGGADVGELFHTAERIRDADMQGWADEFAKLAERVARLAVESEEQGHAVSASEHHLRAAHYHRAVLFGLSPLEHEDRYLQHVQKVRDHFMKGMVLGKTGAEPLDIPFEHATLPGYFFPGDQELGEGKTLMLFGGGDTLVEDLYYFVGAHALRRGYNVVTSDLPGQGASAFDGYVMQPDAETAIHAVFDHVRSRAEIDATKLAGYGLSFGGYLVPRAAAKGFPFKAVIANAIIPDMGRYWRIMPNIERLAEWENTWKMNVMETLFYRKLGPGMKAMEHYKWKWGVETIKELLERNDEFAFDPGELDLPVLLLCPESEYDVYPEIREYHDRALEAMAHPRSTMIIGRSQYGAAHHCLAPNASLGARYAFDWLDEALDG